MALGYLPVLTPLLQCVLPNILWSMPACVFCTLFSGSHDSFSFYIDEASPVGPEQPETVQNFVSVFGTVAKKLMRKWLATQTMNFTSQLEAGVRFFDLRISTKPRDPDNELFFAHGLFSATVSREFWWIFSNASGCLVIFALFCVHVNIFMPENLIMLIQGFEVHSSQIPYHYAIIREIVKMDVVHVFVSRSEKVWSRSAVTCQLMPERLFSWTSTISMAYKTYTMKNWWPCWKRCLERSSAQLFLLRRYEYIFNSNLKEKQLSDLETAANTYFWCKRERTHLRHISLCVFQRFWIIIIFSALHNAYSVFFFSLWTSPFYRKHTETSPLCLDLSFLSFSAWFLFFWIPSTSWSTSTPS